MSMTAVGACSATREQRRVVRTQGKRPLDVRLLSYLLIVDDGDAHNTRPA